MSSGRADGDSLATRLRVPGWLTSRPAADKYAERVRAKLKLEAIDEKVVTLADGSEKSVPYVGPMLANGKTRLANSAP